MKMIKNNMSAKLDKTESPTKEIYSRVIEAKNGINTANKPQANNIRIKTISLSSNELFS